MEPYLPWINVIWSQFLIFSPNKWENMERDHYGHPVYSLFGLVQLWKTPSLPSEVPSLKPYKFDIFSNCTIFPQCIIEVLFRVPKQQEFDPQKTKFPFGKPQGRVQGTEEWGRRGYKFKWKRKGLKGSAGFLSNRTVVCKTRPRHELVLFLKLLG